MYQTRILDTAKQELSKLPKPIAQRVIKRMRWLTDNFDYINPESLKGNLAGFYKLRAGDYRILYEILDSEKMIVIHAIGHRKDFYQKKQRK